MGFLSLGYRRPPHVDKDAFRQSMTSDSFSEKEDASLRSGRSGASAGVPDALTFDKIINGGTCPPMSVRDFMNYLIYIEHSAENLQFFLWHRDYVKRFREAKTSDMGLAPEWTQAMEDDTIAKIQKEGADKLKREPKGAEIFKGTDFEKGALENPIENRDPFSTPPRTPGSNDDASTVNFSQATTYRSQAQDAFSTAGAKQPFTIQPFRDEIDRVVATYLAADAPRQLNLSDREHKVTLQALAYTTHPTAFRLIAKSIENTLRKQAHPNFVRWSICNGNPARVFFARGLGVGTILLATVGAIILTLSRAGRGYRALFAIGWVIGIATLIAAYKGMCVVLHGLHHRHIRPWELFAEDDGESEDKRSFDTFGSGNSYEEEPWVVKYKKRNVVRKVFDREVWIQEPALRQIQDTIFVQSMLSALLLSGVLTAVFVAVPGGHFF
ncbi:hypothetical protein JX265_008198 [Neoarthrinium moseri]|uniref:Regulator of G protein signaling superfamily n=1 Tax=Neoarthrinium moseri TaxID=1658444 RepID=A0A9P9WIM6_9PEZI|nr:uncharacterized protein JN550_004896 [Neoarthrinium moseri]KAI1851996.1 hypothetical protein JX266_002849 [Neoarthrinium moseri]KAI1865151.1 hypothetical protein JX265_008198 [Neoarthrinium moseri]KAI1870750.1 hypothetical protein JN550_004896 [Neoarthrinium moseri]